MQAFKLNRWLEQFRFKLLAMLFTTIILIPNVYAAEPVNRELVLGSVTIDPNDRHPELRPILDYVVGKMADLGITGGSIKMARNNDEMLRMLARGEVDWVSESLVSALLFNQEADAELFLRRWKDGIAKYHSVIFVREDSEIQTLTDLVGHTIAFEDSGSTSAFYLPALAIVEAGLNLEQLNSPRNDSLPGNVGYVFSRAELNTATWVNKNIVSAGGLSHTDWENDNKLPAAFRQDFRIIHETESVPRTVELVKADLEPAIRERLREILLSMHEDPAGRAALTAYEDSAQFDEFSDAELESYLRLSDRIKQLDSQ
ncbi:MAG: PhnD/SsuA/transferrin family substrate-binding protein [Pseudomonadales bacterium]|nr:PhnD/SsuA/transferrin family substrate-binding protein [Pseudomonadales bacterium]